MSVSASAAEIDDAIARYQVRIKVPTLRKGEPRMMIFQTAVGPRKTPFVLQGGFARVFRWTDVYGQDKAVRCFYTTPRPEYLARYETIDEFFTHYLPNQTAHFDFHMEGLVIKRSMLPDATMPIIEMEWVEGDTLVLHVDSLVAKGKTAELRALAGRFIELLTAMRKAGMAHGDLSGENVMVREKDSSVVVIDYDGVYLPAFRGMTTDMAGNPAFQHPEHQSRLYDDRMDYFSALSIYVALLAIAERPALWTQYSAHDPSGKLVSDALLFKPDDYRDPDNSRAFADLFSSSDHEIVRLARVLAQACKGPMDRVPDLLAMLDPEAEQKAAFAVLQEAIRLRDDRRIMEAASAPELVSYAPMLEPQMARQVSGAKERVAQADELDAYLKAGKTREAVQTLLRGGFASTGMGRHHVARMSSLLFTELQDALRANDTPRVLSLWEAVRQEPGAEPYRKAVQRALQERAKQQTEALNRLRRALATSPLDDAAILAAWDDPLLRKDDVEVKWLEPQVAQARARVEGAKKLDRMLGDEEQEDAALELWRNLRLDRSTSGEPLRARVEQVRLRRDALKRVAQAIAGRDSEALLLAWDDALFRGYRHADGFRPRVEEARKRLATPKALQSALKAGKDELAIAMWDKLGVDQLPEAKESDEAVRAAKERWLISRAPRRLTGKIEGDSLYLTWSWPEGLTWVAVAARLDNYPEEPGLDAPPAGQWVWWINKAQYDRRGFVKPIPAGADVTGRGLYVRLFPLARHGEDWVASPHVAPTRLYVRPARTVSYRLLPGTGGERQIEVDASGVDDLPLIQIVLSSRPVQDPASGNQIGWVEDRHRAEDGKYTVSIQPPEGNEWPSPSYLTLFPSSRESAQWLRLLPEGGEPIKLA